MNTILSNHKDKIKECLSIDDFTVEIIDAEASRLTSLSISARHPFFFHALLAVLSNLLFWVKGIKRKVMTEDDDFIFVSCPDTAFRTKTLPLIAGTLKYCIIYLPNFHIPTTLYYDKFFKSAGVRAFFPTVKLKHVFGARRKYATLINKIKVKNKDFETQKLNSVLASFLIYDGVVKDFLREVESFNGKWILEHQKFYFLATVSNLHSRGFKTTELQHGIFFKPVYDFIPLICDKVLCCSNREKTIYIDNGTDANRVEVFGAPLQTLQQECSTIDSSKHYDLLVMMTLIHEKNVDLVSSVLNYIKSNYSSILVRMRPRSRKNDEILLSGVLDGMTLSEEGTPIMHDINICDKVVSFSVDANIEVAKLHKPFVFIWDGENDDEVRNLNCGNKSNYKDEIQKLMKQDFYSTFSEDQYKEILGETDLEKLRNKFAKYIKEKE